MIRLSIHHSFNSNNNTNSNSNNKRHTNYSSLRHATFTEERRATHTLTKKHTTHRSTYNIIIPSSVVWKMPLIAAAAACCAVETIYTYICYTYEYPINIAPTLYVRHTTKGNLHVRSFARLANATHKKCPFHVSLSFCLSFLAWRTFRSDRVLCVAYI